MHKSVTWKQPLIIKLMGKCRVCKKRCDCQLQFCQSCIEDLSDDSRESTPARKKIIEKREINKKKNKDFAAKGKDSQMMEQTYSSGLPKQDEEFVKFCKQSYIDIDILSQRQKKYFRLISSETLLNSNQRLFLAQRVQKIEKKWKSSENRLQKFLKSAMIQEKDVIDALFHIENSSVVTSFFDGKQLPLMISSDQLNNQAGSRQRFILNFGCNLRKGKNLINKGSSYLILKPSVTKRCFFQTIKQNGTQQKLTSFPEDLLASLKDQQIIKILRGFQQPSDCENDVNGYCVEAIIMGSVCISRDVQKIVLSSEQIKPGFQVQLQKTKCKYGTEFQISGLKQ